MGMSADLGELMRSYGLDGNVPVYRSPQTFPGILEQTQPAQGSPYGQLNGMPTLRPYPFQALNQNQEPSFQFNNLPLTPLRTKAPILPKQFPAISTRSPSKSVSAQKKPLPDLFDQRPSPLWRSGAEGNPGGGGR